MIPDSNKRPKESTRFVPDLLDLQMMKLLAEDGSLGYKEMADRLGVDKRTVSSHFEQLRDAGVLKIRAEIDWSLMGIGALAFVGTMTALGEADVARLYEYVRNEPRVLEAYSTLGSDEYFLTVLDVDIQTLREEVLRRLEPLTADLSTAIVSRRIKARDDAAFLSFLMSRSETSGRDGFPD